MIERFACRDLTTFANINMAFSPSVNLIIGENGSGKSHIMKAAYALASSAVIKRAGGAFDAGLASRLIGLFRPEGGRLSALKRRGASGRTLISADFSSGRRVSALFGPESDELTLPDDNFSRTFTDDPTFIPSRETVTFQRGFVGLCSLYDLPFDLTYRDLASSLDIPSVRDGKLRESSTRIIAAIEKICGGRFDFRGGSAVYVSGGEEFSAASTSEGLLKFAALCRLLQNGSIRPGDSGPLFWEHPETNLNPKLLKLMAGILLELSRNGTQIIITTHSYVLLKYLELLRDLERRDEISYHLLTRGEGGTVSVTSADRFDRIGPNSITDAYANLYDTEFERASARAGA